MIRLAGSIAPWLVAVVVSAPTAAQSPFSDGPVLALPCYCFVDAQTQDTAGVALGPAETVGKKAGFASVKRKTGLGSGPPYRPSFDPALIFGTGMDPALEIDAMSIGLDKVAADANGRVAFPPGAWVALVFSIGRNSQGQPDSRIRQEVGRADGAAADLFSYTMPGSNLPADLVGQTHRVLDSTELGLNGPSAAPTPGNIQAVDAYSSLYELDNDVVRRLPTTPILYFSVSNAAILAGAVPTAWWNGSPSSGATILQTRWDRANGRWRPIRPFLTFGALGLSRRDDIDALAYDGACRLLFSLVGVPIGEQLKVANLCPGPDPGVSVNDYELPTGEKVAEEAGGQEGDEMEGICVIDPGIATGTESGPFVFGSPVARPIPFPRLLDAAIYRGCDPAGVPSLVTVMTGWPAEPPVRGRAFLFISADGFNWSFLAAYARDPADALGDPQQVFFGPLPPIGASRVFVVWAAADENLDLAVSHPARIFF